MPETHFFYPRGMGQTDRQTEGSQHCLMLVHLRWRGVIWRRQRQTDGQKATTRLYVASCV